MAGLSSLLNTARDALAAQTFGLNVTGGNVANANTPGYVRRQTLLETRALGTQSDGTVQIAGVRRTTDQYVDQRVYDAGGQASAASEHDTQLASVETLFNDTAGGGLGDALNQMFSAFGALAASPSDPTARQTVLDSAGNFATSAQNAGNAIAQQRGDILADAQSVAQQINQKASDLAKLNQQIAVAENAGADASDLKDRRDQSLTDLSQLVDTRAFTSSDGSMVVQVSGTTLVDGQVARSLSVGLDSSGNMQVSSESPGGVPNDVTKFLTGGQLAGLRDARDVDLKQVGDKLDQLVFDVATAVNATHAAGAGLDGVSGRPLFAVSATAAGAARSISLDPSVVGQPDHVAAASAGSSLPGGSDNAVALAQLGSQAFASGGTRTGADAYADIVGDVGSRKAQTASSVSLQNDVKAQADNLRQSQTSVSLDEEMVSLTQYQRAYEAAGKMIQTVDTLFTDLLATVGR